MWGILGTIRETLKRSYDIFLEFGTGQRGAAKRSTIATKIYGGSFVKNLKFKSGLIGMTRRPFLQPAIENNRKKIDDIFQKEMRRGTNKRI